MPLPEITTLVGANARPNPGIMGRPMAPTIPTAFAPKPTAPQQVAAILPPTPTPVQAPVQAPVQTQPVQTQPVQPVQETITTSPVEFDPRMFAIAIDEVFATSLEKAGLQNVTNVTPYIGFVNEKNQNRFTDMQLGDMYLEGNNGVVKINRHKMWIIDAAIFYTKCSIQDYSILQARAEMTEDELKADNNWQKHAVGIAVVIVNGELVPAKIDFGRSTRTQAVQRSINAIVQARTPEWATRSDQHKIAAQASPVWTRVLHSFNPIYHQSVNGVSHPLNSVSSPATLTDLIQIFTAMQNPDFLNDVRIVRDSCYERVAEIQSKLPR